MDLSRLAAMQKRRDAWAAFADRELLSIDVKSAIKERLARYQAKIVSCWERSTISEQDQHEIANLERELIQLNEEARLLAR